MLTTIVANVGAISGGMIIGHMSTFFGRRLSIIVVCLVGAALIPPWILVRNNGIMAAVFFEQFCVQGAWGYVVSDWSELIIVVLFQFIFSNYRRNTSGRLLLALRTNWEI
jgi:MFS transporter, SHS family, lactate transporter